MPNKKGRKRKVCRMHMQKYLMELVGTMFLTMAITLTGNPIAIGFMLAAMIIVGGHVSGGHFNPAVSLALFLRNRLSLHDTMLYVVMQTAGALVAIMFFNAITNTVFVPDIAAELPLWISIFMEAALTFVFCWVIVTLVVRTVDRQSAHYHMPVLVGFTLMTIAFVGGLFNPAVGLAAFISNIIKNGTFVEMNHLLIYVIAPLVGSVVAAYGYQYFNDNNYQAL